MKNFETLVKEIRNERIIEERHRKLANDNSGENIYINFCCWCNGQANADRTNEDDFKGFLKEENINLNRLQKLYLAKKYFNYVTVYDPINEKWKIYKNDLN